MPARQGATQDRDARGRYPSRNDDTVTVSFGVRVRPETVTKVRRLAEVERRSIASVIGEFVERGMSEEAKAARSVEA